MTTTERTAMRVALERAARRADVDVPGDVLDALIVAAEAQAQVKVQPASLHSDAATERDVAVLRAQSAELADRLERALHLLRGMARKVSAYRRYSVVTERRLTQAQSDAETWLSEYERVRDELLDDLTPEHVHAYPWSSPDEMPGPCGVRLPDGQPCGKPFPRAVEEDDEDVEPELTPWDELMLAVRTELADWPEGGD